MNTLVLGPCIRRCRSREVFGTDLLSLLLSDSLKSTPHVNTQVTEILALLKKSAGLSDRPPPLYYYLADFCPLFLPTVSDLQVLELRISQMFPCTGVQWDYPGGEMDILCGNTDVELPLVLNSLKMKHFLMYR